MKRDKHKDNVAAFLMKLGDIEDFGENLSVYTVEIPTKDQNTQEVRDA